MARPSLPIWFRSAFVLVLALFAAHPAAAQGHSMGFVERFALAEDRAKVLDELVPGTPQHFYYASLYAQSQGDLDGADALMKRWLRETGRTREYRQIEARQALLRVSTDPARTYKFLEDELDLNFAHSRNVPGVVPDLPTSLNPALIDTETLLRAALKGRSGNQMIRGVRKRAYELLLTRNLTNDQRGHLLDALPRADIPGLVEVVVADLAANDNHSFGSRNIHGKLTLEQLEALRGRRPQILSNRKYVEAVLSRLQPGADASLQDPGTRREFLERAWRFVSILSPSFNSLRAHVLFRLVEMDLDAGAPDRARLIEYLRIPRTVNYQRLSGERRAYAAQLGQAFDGLTRLPAVGDDRKVVVDSLLILLRGRPDFRDFSEVLPTEFLRPIWAESQLIFGERDGDATLVEMLGGAGAIERLRDRVELDFARTNPTRFAPGDSVELAVDLKNITTLIVKVFEIDPLAYFDRFGRAVSTDVPLDGLVAGFESVQTLDVPPMRRVRRTIDLPQLEGPGSFVVEAIGGGVSSRAVIVKGELHLLQRLGSAGHVIGVLNGDHEPVKDAVLRFGGRDFPADDLGEILIPFTTDPGTKSVLVRAGGASTVTSIDLVEEKYVLEAGIHVPRESLLAGMSADIVVRPRLSTHGRRVDIGLLEESRLHIVAVDADGVETTQTVEGFALSDTKETTHTIQIPERLVMVRAHVSGKVRSLSEEKDVRLTSGTSHFPINELPGDSTIQALLTLTPEGYAVDVLGRNGEPRRDIRAVFRLRHKFVNREVQANLKSDESGRIRLGRLTEVDRITVDLPGQCRARWDLSDRTIRGFSGPLHGRAGFETRVPYGGESASLTRQVASLIEMRGGKPAVDRFDALALEDGYLVLRGLTGGDYRLVLEESARSHDVRITDGPFVAGHLVGPHRALEAPRPAPLQISAVGSTDDALVVQLGGTSESTRVHVFASRWQSEFGAADRLATGVDGAGGILTYGATEAFYESGRPISDEYRYILNRRLQDAYAGNMLARAGVLLNPWSLRETNTLLGIGGGAGGKYGGRFGGARNLRAAGGAASDSDATSARQQDLDFLATAARAMHNLTPDEQGRVRIPTAALGDRHMISIVAVDESMTVSQRVVRAERELARRDRRLIDGLDPVLPMTQQRRIAFVAAGETVEIRDAANAGAQTLDTLDDVFDLYATLGSGSIAEFEFLTRWGSLDAEEKRARYSSHGCHEVNLFLYRKDRAFFDGVVRPYIANKSQLTFMDRWLLDQDLAGYLEPWQFERLNAVEKILLLQRTGGDAGGVARDMVGVFPPDHFSMDAAFAVVLASGGLEGAPTPLAAAMTETRKTATAERKRSKKNSNLGLGGGGGGAPGGPATPGPDGASAPSGGAAPRSGGDDFFLGRAAEDVVAGLDPEEAEVDAARLSGVLDSLGYGLGAESATPSRGRSQDIERREQAKRLFRNVGATEAFAETHYWHVLRGDMTANLVPISPFWVDFAEADGPFTSTAFALAARNRTEKLLALAVLDLPYEAEEHTVATEGRSVSITAASPMFLALEDIGPATPQADSPILIGQDAFEVSRRTVVVDGVERERFVTGEFLAGVPYGSRIVMTNPSSTPMRVEALVQIPEGAIPLNGTQVTHGTPISLGAYGTRAIETRFYFPETGVYRAYPVQLGAGDRLMAAADPMTFNVVEKLTVEDTQSWDWISQNATVDELVEYLASANPRTLNLSQIAWRMADRGSFDRILAALAGRHVYDSVLWSYGVKHRDDGATERFLGMHSTLVSLCGDALDSPLLTIDPKARGLYEHIAYEPLVNGRVHEFQGERRILNDGLAGQYRAFLKRLCLKGELDGDDRMELSYYLLLQDRIGEAIAAFRSVDRASVATGIQYDYMSAYMDFFTGDVERAAGIAAGYVDHPITRWRDRFRGVIAQVDEIQGRAVSTSQEEGGRNETQGSIAGAEPLLEMRVEAGRIEITHERLDEVELRFHQMDVEFLFSTNPFVRGSRGAFGFVEPNVVMRQTLDGGSSRTVVPIPAELGRANLVVEVRGAGISRRSTYFSGSTVVQGIERMGQLRAVDSASAKPLPKAYVKVYAEMENGQVRFHKDGYTDLRGRFDYVSLSGPGPAKVRRYSVLVMHEEAGASITELAPPVQ